MHNWMKFGLVGLGTALFTVSATALVQDDAGNAAPRKTVPAAEAEAPESTVTSIVERDAEGRSSYRPTSPRQSAGGAATGGGGTTTTTSVAEKGKPDPAKPGPAKPETNPGPAKPDPVGPAPKPLPSGPAKPDPVGPAPKQGPSGPAPQPIPGNPPCQVVKDCLGKPGKIFRPGS